MSVNFNSTTPAAPTGSQNGTFATDGSGNVSVSVPIAPTELIADNVDLTGQGASISATNLVASPSSGMYRVSAYIIVTQVASGGSPSSTLPSIVITWLDKDNLTSQSATITTTQSGNSLTTYAQAELRFSVSSSAAIQYSTTGYASAGTTSMQYALHIRVEEI